jgi:D-lactate dehydrogenase
MNIHFFETEAWEQEKLMALADGHEPAFSDTTLREENAGKHSGAEVLSPFIYSDLDADVLRKLPEVKMIATRSTGVDHIDMDYCREHDITVCNVPEYGENTVAEHVFGLLLTISHNLHEAINRTQKGDFSQQGLQGFDLWGKTLGVIGTGNIGEFVIEIARGFRMEVLAFDVKPRQELAERLKFRYVELDELYSRSDIITLHVPATPKTHHLISEQAFAGMKRGVVLINTARGTLVDIRALLQSLADGKVAAAGLDVLPEEPTIREEAELLRSIFHREHNLETLLANHILLRMRNVYVTPHSAFNTREAVERILSTTIDNIEAFSAGRPQNVVS